MSLREHLRRLAVTKNKKSKLYVGLSLLNSKELVKNSSTIRKFAVDYSPFF